MDFLTILITIVIPGVVLFYLWSTRNHNYFKNLGIPYLKPIPILGNMGDMVTKRKTPAYMIKELYDLNPEAKYVGLFDLSSPVIVLRDPELIKSITIKNFESFPNHKMFVTSPSEPLFAKNLFALQDDTWRDMRTTLSPAFTSSKMKTMFKILSKCAIDFADHMSNPCDKQKYEETDMKENFGKYTLDIIASVAFGLTVDTMKDPDNDFYRLGKATVDHSGFKMLRFFFMRSFPRLSAMLGCKFLDSEASDFFMKVIKTTIATRDAEGIVRPDMIQLLMQARDKKEKLDLSPEDIAAQAFIFLLGGFDGPATTMSFASLALALNQDIQKKLQSEIDEVMAKSCGEVSYEDLQAMKYLDAVVNETLRMFPPNPIMDRAGSKSFTLPPALPGLDPLTIKPDVNIFIPVHSIHHDPKYFPQPDKFDPERFMDENKSNINPLTYFPFGLGPRICIANRFALMEVKLVLFYVFARCNILPTPKTRSPIKLSSVTFPITPVGGFILKIESRK